jgi:uncharacterized membrane protein
MTTKPHDLEPWLPIFRSFAWYNWVGLAMVMAPCVLGFIAVLAWLWGHMPAYFYGMVYAIAALLFLFWHTD